MRTYKLNPINKQKEINIMKQIIHSKKYYILVLDKINDTKNKQKQSTQRTKRTKFRYVGKEMGFVTKHLRIPISRFHLLPTTI
jgi:hypothetical protein